MSFHDDRPGHKRRPGRGHKGFGRVLGWRRGQTSWGGGGLILDDADLCLVILALLAKQPRTGFVTMQILAARGCAGGTVGAMSVYPALILLEDTGLVSAAPDECGRSVYSLTDAGSAELAAKRRLIDGILAEADVVVRQAEPSRGQPRCCQRTIAAIVASMTWATGGALAVERTSAARA
jgi:DNA-binding PadR family transcriptional regulator